MKVTSARVVAVLALMSCLSCGPAKSPERGVDAPLAIGPAAPAPPVEPPRTAALPEAPENLALLVRINDAEQLAREVVSILPPSASAAASLLDPKQLVGLLLGERLGSVVDLAQPIDLASLGTSTPSFALSLAVKQDAETKLGDGLVLREDGGLLRVGKQGAPFGAIARLSECAFTAAAGRAATRLVCASNEATLKAAAPYLARNVAPQPLDADARLSVPGTILREKRDATAKALSDAASARLGNDLVDRFMAEIERVDVGLRFLGTGIEADVDLRLSSRESMLARAIVLRSKPAAPPPAFYRLPADSLVALHTTGALPADIAPLRSALADTIEESLLRDGYEATKTRPLREQVESLLLTGGPLVVGVGVAGGHGGVDKALAALDSSDAPAPVGPRRPGDGASGPSTSPTGKRALEARARGALLPWVLVEVDEPAAKWTQALRDVIRGAADADRTRRPGVRSKTPHDPKGDHVDLRIGRLDPTLALPKDSLHVDVRVTPRTKGARPTRNAHLFVVPKGTATWIGYSEDLSAISSRLRLVLDETTEVGTLARVAGAKALRESPALGAGLVSLGLGLLAAKTATSEDLRAAARRASRIAALGVRGTESVAWTATADSSPGAVRLSVRAQATRQNAVDMVRMLGL